MNERMTSDRWDHLSRVATSVVNETLSALPSDVRDKARQVPIQLEDRPDAALLEDGLEPDVLGLYWGSEFGESADGDPMPPCIQLFLENLWEFSGNDEKIFAEEVATTLLHELGHYLGLDEADLDERGLT